MIPFVGGDFVISERLYKEWRGSEGGEEEVEDFLEVVVEEGRVWDREEEGSGRWIVGFF